MALFIKDCNCRADFGTEPCWKKWYVGQPFPKLSGLVVTFQADGDELRAITNTLASPIESEWQRDRKTLESAGIVLYTTGSQYFGNYSQSSDLDLFTGFYHSNVLCLVTNGFHRLANYAGETCDNNTAAVYRKHYSDGPFPWVDIQLTRNVQLKLDAQEWFRSQGIIPTKTHWEMYFKLKGGI